MIPLYLYSSHEIRTPMNGMMATISGLMENTSNMSFAQRELLQIASNSGTLLTTLINDMIDLTALQSGKLSLGDDPYSIIEVTARVVSSLSAAASNKKLTIVTEVCQFLLNIELILFNVHF